jgi:hypothetical protein
VTVTLVHGPGMNASTCTNATDASGLIAAARAPPPGHDFNLTHYLRWTNPTTVFAPPYDSINFPALGTLDPPNAFPFQDPFTRKYRFTPKVGSMQGGSGGGGLRCTPIHPPHHCNLKTSG